MNASTMKRSIKDDGAMLIIALLIISVVAVVTGALLTLSSTNFAATVTLRKVAATSYSADSAAKIAINDIELGASSGVPEAAGNYPNGAPKPGGGYYGWVYDNNTDGTGCFGKTSAGAALTGITLPNVYTDTQSGLKTSAYVSCAPVQGTGLFGAGGDVIVPGSSDAFARALTTVGTGTVNGAVDGITLKPLGSGTEMPIRGSIQSYTFLSVSNGALRTNGTIDVRTSPATNCTTSGGGSITPACTTNYIAPTTPTSPLSSVPTYRNPAGLCTLQPGYYNNGAALTARSVPTACTTLYLAPGDYYFDFGDGQPWDISTRVIAGTATGSTSIPGTCVSPIGNPSAVGVRLVFGGRSAIKVEDTAQVEICGSANLDGSGRMLPPQTIYQQQTGSVPTAQTIPAAGANAAGTVTTHATVNNAWDAFVVQGGVPADTLQTALSATGGAYAKFTSTKNGNQGELDLSNFAGLNAIPTGSTINSALLNVTYTDGLTHTGGQAVTVPSFVAGVSGQSGTVAVATSGTDTDITSLMSAQFTASGFSGSNPMITLRVVDSKNNNTFQVDRATLRVTYTPPALEPAITAPFIYEQGGNFAGRFVVQGSTFAPNGYINLVPGSNANALVAFRWGVVAWGVNFQSQPSQTWGYPLVSIPDSGEGLGSAVTAVDLKVYLCPGASTCSPGTGTLALTSRTQFKDGVTSAGVLNPIPGQRQVTVLSWAEQR